MSSVTLSLQQRMFATVRQAWARQSAQRIKYVGMSVLAVLVVSYLAMTNSVAAQGYALGEIQKEMKEAEKQQSALTMQVAAAQSLARVEMEASSDAMQPVSNVEYLATSGSSVAVR